MSVYEFVEARVIEGLDDPAVLEAVEAQLGASELSGAEAILSVLRARTQLSTDQKRDRSALTLEIITRRAIDRGDLQAAVGAQKALATLEGLELDPGIAGAKTTAELPAEKIEERIRQLLHENPELREQVLRDH